MAKKVVPSERGELEITSLNNLYLQEGRVHVTTLGRGYSWMDTGTHESLMQASDYVHMVEKSQGLKIACVEEVAYINGWITREQLIELAGKLAKNQYGEYLSRVAEDRIRYINVKRKL